jgi:hypothetical protein
VYVLEYHVPVYTLARVRTCVHVYHATMVWPYLKNDLKYKHTTIPVWYHGTNGTNGTCVLTILVRTRVRTMVHVFVHVYYHGTRVRTRVRTYHGRKLQKVRKL